MKRLGILYPPTGAEFEYYSYGEALEDAPRISLVGVRIYGDDEEHAPQHLERTAQIDNLLLSAANLKPLRPDAVVWACTSGSFVLGADFAQQQIDALAEFLGCPATSTSVAFIAALNQLGIQRIALLASYPKDTSARFTSYLAQQDIEVCDQLSLGAASGPDAAQMPTERLMQAARRLDIPADAALLVPDTAIPSLALIEQLEQQTGRTVLTANQVSLWHCARLAGLATRNSGPGRLFQS